MSVQHTPEFKRALAEINAYADGPYRPGAWAASPQRKQVTKSQVRVMKSQPVLTYRVRDQRDLVALADALTRRGWHTLSKAAGLGQWSGDTTIQYGADATGLRIELYGPAEAIAAANALIKALPVGERLYTPERFEQLRKAFPDFGQRLAEWVPPSPDVPVNWAFSYYVPKANYLRVVGILSKYGYSSYPPADEEELRLQCASSILNMSPEDAKGGRVMRVGGVNPNQTIHNFRTMEDASTGQLLFELLRPIR